MPPGFYRVTLTWLQDAAAGATSARYALLEDHRADRCPLSRRNAPSGDTVADRAWQSLAIVQVTSGVLRVELTGGDTGTLYADAIRLIDHN